MDDKPLCNRCLIQVNATSAIMARGVIDGRQDIEICPFPTNPLGLAAWAREMLYDRGWEISVNDTRFNFRPVATWHGDPVCCVCLWWLVDAERRAYRRLNGRLRRPGMQTRRGRGFRVQFDAPRILLFVRLGSTSPYQKGTSHGREIPGNR